jgi:hypothetical protein
MDLARHHDTLNGKFAVDRVEGLGKRRHAGDKGKIDTRHTGRHGQAHVGDDERIGVAERGDQPIQFGV